MFRPWLFQAPAGSYQFAVRVQEPAQMGLFDERPAVSQVTSTFFKVLQATANDPERDLPRVVEDQQYRKAFLNLTRNLAPTGRVFERLDVTDAGLPGHPVASFVPQSRQQINTAINKSKPKPTVVEETTTLIGVLRALHLDQDWLEVTLTGDPEQHVKIDDAGEALDDVVGPMVNRLVRVTAVHKGRKYSYTDIELEE